MKTNVRLTAKKLYGFSVLCCCLCFSLLINTKMHNNDIRGKMIDGKYPLIEKVELQNPVYFTVFSKDLNF